MGESCSCGTERVTLLFACSGGSDVGEVADRAARKLTGEGAGAMYCLAGIGGQIGGIVKTTEAADRIVVIDGCQVGCGAATLHQAGFRDFLHVCVTDLGLRKGTTEVGEPAIHTVAEAVKAVL
jgi:uncharacterized metal-binding protein